MTKVILTKDKINIESLSKLLGVPSKYIIPDIRKKCKRNFYGNTVSAILVCEYLKKYGCLCKIDRTYNYIGEIDVFVTWDSCYDEDPEVIFYKPFVRVRDLPKIVMDGYNRVFGHIKRAFKLYKCGKILLISSIDAAKYLETRGIPCDIKIDLSKNEYYEVLMPEERRKQRALEYVKYVMDKCSNRDYPYREEFLMYLVGKQVVADNIFKYDYIIDKLVKHNLLLADSLTFATKIKIAPRAYSYITAAKREYLSFLKSINISPEEIFK